MKENNKMVIPIKKVKVKKVNTVEQKNYLQLRLNKLCDYDIVCGKSYNWIETLKQNENDRTYKYICDSLKKNYNRKKFKNNTKLVYMDSFENYIKKCRKNIQFDFVCESMKSIIEYDEEQHFSKARKYLF